MTQEDKQLLLKDLCGRLFCGVKYTIYDDKTGNTAETLLDIRTSIENEIEIDLHSIEDVKLYLRSMSSMTDEELEELNVHGFFLNNNIISNVYATEQVSAPGFKKVMKELYTYFDIDSFVWLQEFFNSRHLDYRGLIPMGLALEAPKDMYKTE